MEKVERQHCVSFTYANMHADEAEMTRVNAITMTKQLKCFYLLYSHQQPTQAFFQICLTLRGLATDEEFFDAAGATRPPHVSSLP